MLQSSTLSFLKKLKKNNNKPWFDANKKEYELAKQDFINLVEDTLKELSKKDIRFGELEAKKCIFRINRDVRFSKDKSPYKTNFGASFIIGGKKSPLAGFYIHLEPGNSFMGGGLWMPEPESLKKMRQEIDYNFKEFKTIVEGKAFKAHFGSLAMEDALKNPPKGYDAENPAIEYLKLKHYVTSRRYSDETLLDKGILKEISKSFNTILPLISFINRAISDEG